MKTVATEGEIVQWVNAALADVFAEAFDKFELKAVCWKEGFFIEPDLTIFCNNFPIGCVEVKKQVSLSDANVIGEVFDQLMHLKQHWLIACPFSILTSYTEWVICWLNEPGSMQLAQEECALTCTSESIAMPETPVKIGSVKGETSPPQSPEHHADVHVDLGEVVEILVSCSLVLIMSSEEAE